MRDYIFFNKTPQCLATFKREEIDNGSQKRDVNLPSLPNPHSSVN